MNDPNYFLIWLYGALIVLVGFIAYFGYKYYKNKSISLSFNKIFGNVILVCLSWITVVIAIFIAIYAAMFYAFDWFIDIFEKFITADFWKKTITIEKNEKKSEI